MCKQFEFPKYWDGKDELEFYVNVDLIPEQAVDADELKGIRNEDLPGNKEDEIPVDKLLLDGMDIEFPERKRSRGIRHKATRRVNNRRINTAKTVGGCYNTINRGENGKTKANNEDEWKSSIVATKKNDKSGMAAMGKKMDRRKTRHEGKAECREIPDVFMDDAEEERREFYKEKADGTVDVDFCLRHNWLYADLDDGIYGEEYDEEDDYEPEYMSREWCEMECIDYDEGNYDDDDYDEDDEIALTYAENSRLKMEIATYNDFLEEFNLSKLYQTWLAQKGN